MITHIAIREVKDHVRTCRYLVLSSLALVLMGLGTYLSAKSYSARVDAHSAMQREQERALGETAFGPVRLRGYGWVPKESDVALRALRSPAPLSVWAGGVDAALPGYWQFSPAGALEGPPLGDISSAIATRATIDYLFVCEVILGLLAVLLTFDSISGERESGTLRATLAHPVPRNSVVIGKFGGAMLTLLPLLFLGTLVSLLIAAASGITFWREDGLVRLAVLTTGALGYVALFSALGVLVSTTVRSGKTSLVMALVLWSSLVFVVPRVAALVATIAHPVALADAAQRRREGIATELESERRTMLASAWERATANAPIPAADFPPTLREAYDRVRLPLEQELFRKRRSLLRAEFDEKARALHRRAALFQHLSWLSPASILDQLAGTLAATGNDEATRWSRQVEAHQRVLEAAAFDRVFGTEVFNSRIKLLISWGPDPSVVSSLPPDIRDLPRFHMRARSTRDIITPAAGGVLSLAVAAAVLLAGACVSFQRYDVRGA